MLSFSDLSAPVTDLKRDDTLGSWRWLAGVDSQPLLLTALGDLFVEYPSHEVAFLDSYDGVLSPVAPDRARWTEALGDVENLEAWFKPGLVGALRDRGLALSEGQCYSPVHPPILGGSMEPENFEVTDWRVHVGVMGQIHEQVKDLPPGTPITGFHVG